MMMSFLKKSLIVTATAAMFSTPALANDQTYNRISFNSEVTSQIANDELRASMSKTTQATTATAIAKELNGSLNAVMQIAKRYPEVTVTTGSHSTYPRYANNSSKIIGFTGKVSIDIKSNNLEKAGQLIADLQSLMVMDHISFDVSEKLRSSEEKRLQLKAIQRFHEEATSISQAFGSSGYKIVHVNLGGDSNHYARPMMVSMKAMDSTVGIEAPSFEAGNTTLTYTANGTIEIIP